MRLRERLPSRRAKNASSRSPASPGSTRKARLSIASGMAAYDPDDEEAPLDPAAERLRRKLARLLIVSGGIMMLGLIAVFAAIVYKLGVLGDGGPAPLAAAEAGFPGELVDANIAVPPDARLVAADIDGARALLHLEAPDGSSLLLVDLATGEVLGRYALQPE